MRARWREERAPGATGETFARWRLRVRAEVLDELRKVLDGDQRRWPDPRNVGLDQLATRRSDGSFAMFMAYWLLLSGHVDRPQHQFERSIVNAQDANARSFVLFKLRGVLGECRRRSSRLARCRMQTG
jgi:hypothetical protein